MGPMVLSIRLDRADRIARERRKAKQFWPTPGVSLTSARACMRAVFARQRIQRHRRGAPPPSDSSGAPYGRNVRLADLLTAARKGPGPVPRRLCHRRRGNDPASGGLRWPGVAPPISIVPSQERGHSVTGHALRWMRFWEKKNLSVRSTRKVDYEKYSPRLYMPGCAHDLTAERQI
jgi:hypothetical protein